MFGKIKLWYAQGLWSDRMVREAVNKGIITEEQYKEITGQDY